MIFQSLKNVMSQINDKEEHCVLTQHNITEDEQSKRSRQRPHRGPI